ncbi:MAG: NUDIX hydrolase [Xanthobacteraceae bacterium]|nr:NUDIX hydrolase [Xanthobacteraceae bacterium]
MGKAKTPQVQCAALPYRRLANAAIEVMLITSRDTGRWVIPKGWQDENLGPQDSAEREAREEGGLVGRIGARPIGHYRYRKRLPDGSSVPCSVEVFPLEVKRQLKSWPERKERHTRWFMLREAAAAVQERELAAMIRSLRKLLMAAQTQPAKTARRRVTAA